MSTTSLAKLTSQSTQTLSLLLERQRIQTLPSFSSNGGSNGTHLTQITNNLNALHSGILELEGKEGKNAESVRLLRSQYERMRGMLGGEADVPALDSPEESTAASEPLVPAQNETFTPYTDDDDEPVDHGIMLQTQRQMMDEQDQRLEVLSNSISRQHHISLQINDELESHVGLLEELDNDVDRTSSRLNAARKRLDQVARGAKNNASTVTIGLLIFVLLILIIKFKT